MGVSQNGGYHKMRVSQKWGYITKWGYIAKLGYITKWGLSQKGICLSHKTDISMELSKNALSHKMGVSNHLDLGQIW